MRNEEGARRKQEGREGRREERREEGGGARREERGGRREEGVRGGASLCERFEPSFAFAWFAILFCILPMRPTNVG